MHFTSTCCPFCARVGVGWRYTPVTPSPMPGAHRAQNPQSHLPLIVVPTCLPTLSCHQDRAPDPTHRTRCSRVHICRRSGFATPTPGIMPGCAAGTSGFLRAWSGVPERAVPTVMIPGCPLGGPQGTCQSSTVSEPGLGILGFWRPELPRDEVAARGRGLGSQPGRGPTEQLLLPATQPRPLYWAGPSGEGAPLVTLLLVLRVCAGCGVTPCLTPQCL